MFLSHKEYENTINELKKGTLIDEISNQMSWQNFERLVAEILETRNFATKKNVMLRNPRRQIDVIGSKFNVVITIDCKHWKKYSSSTLQKVVKNQIERTRHYLSKTSGMTGIPVIVTLDCEKINFVNKVPVVPIQKFESFMNEVLGNLDEIRVLRAL